MLKINRNRKIFKSELTLRKKQYLFLSKKKSKKTIKSFAYLIYVFLFSIASTFLFGYFAFSNTAHIKEGTNLKDARSNSTIKKQIDPDKLDEIFGDINNALINNEKLNLLLKKWLNEYKYEFNRTPPENYEKWINFTVKNNCPLHPKYYTQINKDLKPFRDINSATSKKISYNMIIEASKLSNIVLVFLNNKFFYVNKQDSNINEYKKLFSNDLLNILTNRTILIPFNLLDEPRVLLADDNQNINHNLYKNDRFYAFKRNNCLKKNFEKLTQFHSYFSYSNLTLTPLLPIFSRSRTKCHSDILIPAYYHMKPGLVDKITWKDKQDIFKWHGSTIPLSEAINTEASLFGLNDKIQKQPRTRLIDWSLKIEKDSKLPVKLDISLTKIRGCQSNACEYIKKNYRLNENFNEMDTFQAKYVCVIDSFKRSSSKFLNYLFSKSVLLVSTIFEEWYSGIILPWQHYIPFQIDFSDLEKNIIWAFKNQSEAQKISLRGQISSHKYLNFKSMQCYTGLLILEYAHLLI
jgi:hypothetical protein